jgi:IS1 family transposase
MLVNMNRLDNSKRTKVVQYLVEGNSIRATVRMTNVAKNTVTKLLVDLGIACARYQDETLRKLPCHRVQCDEILSFIGAKQKDVLGEQMADGWGDVGTWTAIDADTKLVPCWMVGQRGLETAIEFINDLASRLSHRVQLTTDGHRPYLNSVEDAFGGDINFAELIKIYGTSTSFAERQNLTIRMRRFTRLADAFSKKLENHMAAITLHFMYYNFVRVHQTLRVTPAMEAGVANHVWTVEEIISLLEPESKLDGIEQKSLDSS